MAPPAAAAPTTATLSAEAYAKIVLHAARHPGSAVSGLLLASAGDEGHASTSQPAETVAIVDAVHLFHRWATLSPMAEVAVQQVLIHCAANKLRIAGYYHANELADDSSVPLTAAKIASALREVSPGPIILIMVDNKKLASARSGSEVAILPHVFKEDRWRPVMSDSAGMLNLDVDAHAAALAATKLREEMHYKIVDFDDHLDDVRQDWLRPL